MLSDALRLRPAGIVDQHIDAPPLPDYIVHHLACAIMERDIGLIGETWASQLLDFRPGARHLGCKHVDEHKRVTALSEGMCTCTANTARASRNNCNSSVLCGHSVLLSLQL
jgi:hypothetical protein